MPLSASEKRRRRGEQRFKTLKCQRCGQSFQAARRDAKYCSPACRHPKRMAPNKLKKAVKLARKGRGPLWADSNAELTRQWDEIATIKRERQRVQQETRRMQLAIGAGKRDLAGHYRRQFEHRHGLIMNAIIAEALQHRRPESETVASAVDAVIGLFNDYAERIVNEFGCFSVRLAHALATEIKFVHEGKPDSYGQITSMLDWLEVTTGNPVYRWMSDFLFMTCFVPAQKVIQEAHGADGLWNTKLRKRKQAMEARRQAFVMEVLLEQKARRQEDDTRDLALKIRGAHDWMLKSIRHDKTTKDGLPRESYADFYLSKPIMHRPVGMKASNLTSKDE